MIKESADQLMLKIAELENRLAESEQLIDAIKAGEVDAFAISTIISRKYIRCKAATMLTVC